MPKLVCIVVLDNKNNSLIFVISFLICSNRLGLERTLYRIEDELGNDQILLHE
jgi:hypothetical protein